MKNVEEEKRLETVIIRQGRRLIGNAYVSIFLMIQESGSGIDDEDGSEIGA